MRIPSGVTDQYIYFVAVDATDLKTRETGLSTWTVYRSRNGGAAAAMTTPTINETDATNMPGVYELLLDEDMTIDSDDSQEMVFHITHSGMAPVTRTIELYRPKITAGETLTVSSGAVSTVTAVTTVNGLAANTVTASALATDAVTEIQSGLATAAALTTVDDFLDTEIAAIKTVTDRLDTAMENDGGVYRFTTNALELAPTGGSAPTASQIADEVQTRTIAAVTTVNGLAANSVTASALAADAVAEIADGFLDRNMATGSDSGSTTVRTPRQALRFLRNKWAVSAGTLTVYKEDDSTSSWTAAVTGDAAADPIVSSDPGGP
jgi:hypothetical protein